MTFKLIGNIICWYLERAAMSVEFRNGSPILDRKLYPPEGVYDVQTLHSVVDVMEDRAHQVARYGCRFQLEMGGRDVPLTEFRKVCKTDKDRLGPNYSWLRDLPVELEECITEAREEVEQLWCGAQLLTDLVEDSTVRHEAYMALIDMYGIEICALSVLPNREDRRARLSRYFVKKTEERIDNGEDLAMREFAKNILPVMLMNGVLVWGGLRVAEKASELRTPEELALLTGVAFFWSAGIYLTSKTAGKLMKRM
jgi:hypothetical protein